MNEGECTGTANEIMSAIGAYNPMVIAIAGIWRERGWRTSTILQLRDKKVETKPAVVSV